MRHGNFSYVIDSSFQPFSMQEMLQPLVAYKDAFEKTEAAYDELNQKAGDIKYFADSLPEGSKAKAVYDNYTEELSKQAQDFAKHGLTMMNRRSLMDLRRRYPNEIGILEKANAARQEQMKEQHDLMLKDPTRLFSREAKVSSIDDYLNNPDLTYQSYSGALLAKQVNDAAASIAKSLVDYTNGKPLDGNTRTWLQQHGLTALEVAEAIANPESMRSSKVLNTLMSSVMESSGIPEWADPATLKKAYLYASQGLWKAIGEDKVGTYKLPVGRGGSSSTSITTVPQLPSFAPSVPVAPQKPVASNSNAGSTNGGRKGRRYTFAFGGNLFTIGGDTDTPQKVKISPQLGQMLDQMDDATYNAFMAEQAGTPNYTEAQEDSVLQAYDKQLTESMQAQYLRKLYEESYPEVEQVSPSYNPRNVMTTLEDTQTAYDTKMMKKYGKYFYKTKDGHYMITNEGRTAYKNTPYVYRGKYSTAMNSSDDEFKRWIDQHGLTEMAKGRTGTYQSGIVDNMKSRVNRKYDANLATEYYRNFDSDQYNDILGQLNIIANEGKLPKYKRVKEGNSYTFKPTNDMVDVSDMKDIKGIAAVYGIHGNYLEVATKGGEKLYVPMGMVNQYYDNVVASNINRARALGELQKKGSKVVQNSKGQVEPIELSIIRALNAAGNNMISAFSTSGAKKQEVVRDTYR